MKQVKRMLWHSGLDVRKTPDRKRAANSNTIPRLKRTARKANAYKCELSYSHLNEISQTSSRGYKNDHSMALAKARVPWHFRLSH